LGVAFRIQGLRGVEFRVHGLGLGLGFRAQCLGFGFEIQSLGAKALGVMGQGLGSRM
jgi:hypothetical protein